MFNPNELSPEMIQALKEAGFELTPKELLVTPQEKAQKVRELEEVLIIAKHEKDEALAKKIRRQQRKLMGGSWRKKFSQLMLSEISE